VQLSCEGTNSEICDNRIESYREQMYTELDPKKVEQLARDAARYAHDEAMGIPLYRVVNVYAMKPKIDFLATGGSTSVELKNLRLGR
jgi:ABC-type transport system substrate-binding protein